MRNEQLERDWDEFRDVLDARMSGTKDSQRVWFGLIERYRNLSVEERIVIDAHLAKVLERDDQLERADALVVIQEYEIASALPAVQRLVSRLADANSFEERQYHAQANRIAQQLTQSR